MMREEVVIIVGAGPSGIATSVCLNHLSIPNIVLEREDCLASLWAKKCYDRLHLQIPKQLSHLPYMSFPANYPKYPSKDQFVMYMENYASQFKVSPLYNRLVELAMFEETTGKWCVDVKNTSTGDAEKYVGRFLVVATGVGDPYAPEIEGLDSFKGEVLHSTEYKNGAKYVNKNVLVVGSGNSGMDIALDLANFGAKTSIVVRSPIHIINREMACLGVMLMKSLPLNIVDWLLILLSKLRYGDTTKYGIARPKKGHPFFFKDGRLPVIDVGAYNKIKSGHIQVLPLIRSIAGDCVEFLNGKSYQFEVVVLATGFRRSTNKWLKDGGYLLNESDNEKTSLAHSWKGRNGLYCAGLSKRGLHAAGVDAEKIANDIKSLSQITGPLACGHWGQHYKEIILM
ncbi:Pyridine nucleotide-disulfide oxidoreductase [Macleaya cordata]|uniref:Flavin-containing monooxygenase n=1 Tax=Macleaya cordata TaxID=56857 RepID=A0A200QXB1_MACCD|nr:Pyridine nucleotide-disulfide oxidoreductase [Macleaya cordata]